MIPANNPFTATATFRDATGALVDPASGITIEVTSPDNQATRYLYPAQVVKVSVGTYAVTVQGLIGKYTAVGWGTLDNGFIVTSPIVPETLGE